MFFETMFFTFSVLPFRKNGRAEWYCERLKRSVQNKKVFFLNFVKHSDLIYFVGSPLLRASIARLIVTVCPFLIALTATRNMEKSLDGERGAVVHHIIWAQRTISTSTNDPNRHYHQG